MARFSTWVVALAMALFSAQVQAELTPAQRKDAESLIKQFSAPEFQIRQAAVHRLVEIGRDIVPLVRMALAETQDNEVKLRCRMVLKALEPPKVETPDAKAAPDKFGTDAARVTIHLKGGTLEEALGQLSLQSGNARLSVPEEWDDRAVTFDANDLPYWQALDRLCAPLGLMYVCNLQTGEFSLAPLRDTEDVSAYAGPVIVKLGSSTVARRFRKTGGMDARIPGGRGLSLSFVYFHEPRLHPLESEAEVTKLVAQDGRVIALNADGGDEARAMMNRMMPGWGGGESAFFDVTAPNPPADLAKLASIEGVVRLTFGEGAKEMKVADALGADKPTVTLGNAKLTVTSSLRNNGNGAPGDGVLVLSVRHEVDGGLANLPSFGRESKYGFALIDPKGKRYAAMGAALGGGMFRRMMIRPDGNNPPPPPPMDVEVRGDDDDSTQVVFANVPEMEGAWSLVLTTPERTVKKEYPFKFTDVPLR